MAVAMGFYEDSVYPLLVDKLGNPPPIQALRQEIMPSARGTVLEIGVGAGANFPYYDASKIGTLTRSNQMQACVVAHKSDNAEHVSTLSFCRSQVSVFPLSTPRSTPL